LSNEQNSYVVTSADDGMFGFENVMAGTGYILMSTDEDIDYWNGEDGYQEIGEITGGETYSMNYLMQPYEAINRFVTVDAEETGGNLLTMTLQMENNSTEIWGIQMDIPEGVTVLEKSPLTSNGGSFVVMSPDEMLTTDEMLVWQGIGSNGLGTFLPGMTAEVTFTLQMQNAREGEKEIFYRVYSRTPGDFDQPLYDFGTIPLTTALGIFDRNDIETVSVYPNPGSGKIYVKLDQEAGDETTFKVYGIRGKAVYQKTKQLSTGGANTVTLDLTFLPRGLYFLEVNSGNKRYSAKILLND